MDDASIVATLRQAATSDSRELDRICERVAARLMDARTEPVFEVQTADFDRPLLICAERYWRLRFQAVPAVGTAAACAAWTARHVAADVRGGIQERWALGYGDMTRDTIESRRELDTASAEIIRKHHGAEDIIGFVALYQAAKLRANLWWDELGEFLESAPLAAAAGAWGERPVFAALRAFAAFGSRPVAVDRATAVLEGAWHAGRGSREVAEVCLHALAAAVPFDGRGILLRRYAEEAAGRFPTDATVWYRLAVGQQWCGDADAAASSIDRALQLTPAAAGDRPGDMRLQQELLATRERIHDDLRQTRAAAKQETSVARQEASIARQEAAAVRLRRGLRWVLRWGAVAAVAAAVTLTAGVWAILGSALPLGQRAWLLVAWCLLVGAAVTVAVWAWDRLVVSWPRRRDGTRGGREG